MFAHPATAEKQPTTIRVAVGVRAMNDRKQGHPNPNREVSPE
jgi:hypothetical protein